MIDLKAAIHRMPVRDDGTRWLTLVRHGHSQGNLADHVTGCHHDALTEIGEAQAGALAERLEVPSSYDLVYSSSAKRALQTAQLAGFSNPRVAESLCETHGGQWSSVPRAQFDLAFPDFFAPLEMSRSYPGGESHQEMAGRVTGFLEELALLSFCNGILFTHLGPINTILHMLLNVELHRFPMFRLSNCATVRILFSVHEGHFRARQIQF